MEFIFPGYFIIFFFFGCRTLKVLASRKTFKTVRCRSWKLARRLSIPFFCVRVCIFLAYNNLKIYCITVSVCVVASSLYNIGWYSAGRPPFPPLGSIHSPTEYTIKMHKLGQLSHCIKRLRRRRLYRLDTICRLEDIRTVFFLFFSISLDSLLHSSLLRWRSITVHFWIFFFFRCRTPKMRNKKPKKKSRFAIKISTFLFSSCKILLISIFVMARL